MLYFAQPALTFVCAPPCLDMYGSTGPLKPVKFRVELSTQTNLSSPLLSSPAPSPDLRGYYPTTVTLVMEKGAHSTFKAAYNRLRAQWELDNPRFNGQGGVRLIPSPMPSPAIGGGGRTSILV